MESDIAIQKEMQSLTNNSSMPNSETTLFPPLCPRPPEDCNDNDNTLKEITEIKNKQPCIEIDGNPIVSLPKKTQQDFFEKLMTKMEDREIKDNVSNTLGIDIVGTDSNENITDGSNSAVKVSDMTLIVEKVHNNYYKSYLASLGPNHP